MFDLLGYPKHLFRFCETVCPYHGYLFDFWWRRNAQTLVGLIITKEHFILEDKALFRYYFYESLPNLNLTKKVVPEGDDSTSIFALCLSAIL